MAASTLERVIQIVAQATNSGPERRLEASTLLDDSGVALDSVALLEVLVALETEFEVEIPAEELARGRALHSIGRLAELVQQKLDARSSATPRE